MKKNKTTLLVAVLVIVMAASGLVLGAPRLTIDNSSFNFGFVPQNSKISHDFWLKSTGDDTLKILKVVPG